MRISLLPLLLLLSSVAAFSMFREESGPCDYPNELTLTSLQTLGKQDDQYLTWKEMEKKVPSLGTAYHNDADWSYRVQNTTTFFSYTSEKQKVEVNNNSVLISGGRLEATVTFDWIRYDPNFTPRNTKGTANATALSAQIIFSKELLAEGSDMFYQVKEAESVSWVASFAIPDFFRIDGRSVFESLLSSDIFIRLKYNVSGIYLPLLSKVVRQNPFPYQHSFNYTWASREEESPLTLKIVRRPLMVSLTRDGVRCLSDLESDQQQEWQCSDQKIPSIPLDPKKFGFQHFLDNSFYTNILRTAAKLGYLDANLVKQRWSSQRFRFLAGDLFDVLPLLKQKYTPTTPITGYCTSQNSHSPTVSPYIDTLEVSFESVCSLYIENQQIVEISISLKLQVQMAVFESAVYLDLKDMREQINFFPHYPYQLQNQSYAEDLVKESVGRIREVNLFGNGFPLPKVPSPQSVIYSSFTLFYSGLGSGRKGMKQDSGSLRSDEKDEDALWEQEELDYLQLE